MAQYAANASINFERPAPVFVCAVLVAATLTKVGHRSGPSARRSARIRTFGACNDPLTCSVDADLEPSGALSVIMASLRFDVCYLIRAALGVSSFSRTPEVAEINCMTCSTFSCTP
jgi:hypothetical protein